MKRGTYVRIPQGPGDLERLWHEAEPLDPAHLPSWIWREHAGRYRRVDSVSLAKLPASSQRELLAEIDQVEAAGLLVDVDQQDQSLRHIYVAASPEDEAWSIGIYVGESPLAVRSPLEVENPVLTREHVTDVPAAAVADPFMVRKNDLWYMFFEVLNRSNEKGEIGLAVSETGLNWSYQQIVLSEPFHLSYPYVFEWKHEFYMVPEMFQSGSIGLYKASKFPVQWSFVGTLIKGGYFVDNSVFLYQGKWWLLTETNPEVKHDTLRLFYADDIVGPWQEHASSPIVQGDPRIARPAGRVLVLDDVVIRFAQNCQGHYGTDVRAFEIIELSTKSYQERAASQSPVIAGVGTGWNACGMHHIDPHRLGDGRWIACVDGWSYPGCL
jgi:hypothetical protein